MKKFHICIGILTVMTCAYWAIAFSVHNIYASAIGGAVIEILWLPMIIAIVALPVISIYFWAKEKFSLRSLFFCSLILMAITASICISIY